MSSAGVFRRNTRLKSRPHIVDDSFSIVEDTLKKQPAAAPISFVGDGKADDIGRKICRMENQYRLAGILSDLNRPAALIPVSLVLLERSICENGKVQFVTVAEDAHRIALADVLERYECGLESVVLGVVAGDLNQRVLVAESCGGSDRCIVHNFLLSFL